MISTRKIQRKKSFLFLVLALGLSGVIYSGCSQGFSGDSLVNSRPQARFVNIPPDGSTFSANPTINWVGTDIDGRVVEFRYVVREMSKVPAGMTPEEYALDSIPFSEWIVKPVTLDDPASSDTVALSADFANPVTVFIQQYLFLVAVDDKGAISDVVYRLFGRNDHFPNTRVEPPFAPGGAFVNVPQERFGQGGIPVVWSGDDPLDFPGAEEGVPLEFQWRLYGPYTQAESTMIMDSFIVPVFVTNRKTYNIGDTLVDTAFDFTKADTALDSIVPHQPDSLGDTLRTLDTFLTVTVHIDSISTLRVDTAAADSALIDGFGDFERIVDLNKVDSLDANPGERLIRTSFNPVTGDVWTTQRNAKFFDVYRDDASVIPGSPGDTTRQNSFLFWVQARDDALVPDPAPSFTMIPVINPKHERDLLVLSESPAPFRAAAFNGLHFSCGVRGSRQIQLERKAGMAKVKSAYAALVSKWIPGSVGPDGSYGFDTGSFDPCNDDSLLIPPSARNPSGCVTQGILAMSTSPDFLELPTSQGTFTVRLRDILKHKVIIYSKETLQRDFGFAAEGGDPNQFLVQGILSGNNYWMLMRSPFQQFTSISLEIIQALAPYMYGITPTGQGLPLRYAQLFGIQGGFEPSWYGMAVSRNADQSDPVIDQLKAVRGEDFIGAVPSELVSSADFPPLSVDPVRLETMLTWLDTTTCSDDKGNLKHYPFMDSIAALPDVGFTIPTTSAGTETLYLYKSRFGEAKYPFWNLTFGDMQGTVVAVRRDGGFFRTSHWQFTPLTMDQDSFQPAFNTMMDWLFARPWGGPSFGKAPNPAPPVPGKYASEFIELSKSVESVHQNMLNEAFGGKRFFKNQLEYEQQLKDYLQMKKLQAEADEQAY